MKRPVALLLMSMMSAVAITACSTKSESPDLTALNANGKNNGQRPTSQALNVNLSGLAGLWTEAPEAKGAATTVGIPFCRVHMSIRSGVPMMAIYEILPDGAFYQLLLLPDPEESSQAITFRGVRTQVVNGIAKFYIGKIRSNGVLDFEPEAAVFLDSRGGSMTKFVQSLQGQIKVAVQNGRLYFVATDVRSEEKNEVVAATTQHLQGLNRIGVSQMDQYRLQIQLCRKTMPPVQKQSLSPAGFQEVIEVD